jgi:hypothetical protein
MVMFDHIKPDVSCLDQNQTLLNNTSSFLKATTNREGGLEGCYMYYDMNNHEWIRSGKAVGSNYKKRHTQHGKSATLSDAESQKSKFYSSYPSRDANLPDTSGKKGEFENLDMFVGISFNKLLKFNLLHDVKTGGGIFHFDKETNEKINAVNFRGSSSLASKQVHMLGYLWELAYDLCIAPGSNISGNAGFEVLLGIN